MSNNNVKNENDQGAKIVFGDAEMCAQFLHDYIPIVYFEGTGQWTAAVQFSQRIALSDIFSDYVPDFRYEVVRIHDYSNAEIISKGNELSLIMLINKLKNSEDIKALKDLPKDYLENLQEYSPQHLLELIATVVSAFMHRMNIPNEEIADFTDQILERRISMLFDSFEAYDVQETRKISRAEGKIEGKIEERISSLLEILGRIGKIPDDLYAEISAQTDLDILKQWFTLALQVSSIEEFREKIRE